MRRHGLEFCKPFFAAVAARVGRRRLPFFGYLGKLKPAFFAVVVIALPLQVNQ